MSNSVIAPAILAENADQYKEQVDKITGLVERVHIDISDGEFAPTLTVGISELWAPEGWMIDIHAMVNDVADYVPKLIALRPHMIIVHAEATGDVKTALMQIRCLPKLALASIEHSSRYLGASSLPQTHPKSRWHEFL